MTKYMWLSVALFAIGVVLLIMGIRDHNNSGLFVGIAAMAAGVLAFFTRREKPKQTPDDKDSTK
ncbi:MAG: hypothetical protein ACYDG5_05065 [Dehalococcoidales bacterium]